MPGLLLLLLLLFPTLLPVLAKLACLDCYVRSFELSSKAAPALGIGTACGYRQPCRREKLSPWCPSSTTSTTEAMVVGLCDLI